VSSSSKTCSPILGQKIFKSKKPVKKKKAAGVCTRQELGLLRNYRKGMKACEKVVIHKRKE